jgi:hypothetical protein
MILLLIAHGTHVFMIGATIGVGSHRMNKTPLVPGFLAAGLVTGVLAGQVPASAHANEATAGKVTAAATIKPAATGGLDCKRGTHRAAQPSASG